MGAAVAATNDVHYHAAERRPLQDALSCVREHCDLATAGFRLMGNAERHLKSPEAMRALFEDWPEAPWRPPSAAAETCAFSLGELRYRYPSEWIPEGRAPSPGSPTWPGKAPTGAFPRACPMDLRAMLERELALVARLGFADYFLTVQELVEFARSRRHPLPGRGSAANSVLCFVLGVTAVNPVQIGLLFERFLSEERAEPPDIDVDFEHERREEVIQHLYEKYGRHRAAMVAAVIKYRSRSARADLSKALGLPPSAGEGEAVQPLAGLLEQVEDFPRHLSIHSGGFVLSGEPLSDLVPIEPGRMPGRTVVQWDKFDLDYLGMMKVDVLALGMLSALKRGLDLLGLPDLAAIPLEDPATYAMLQQADTLGVFQVESRSQMNMLGRLKPAHFYDLVIQVAIVRPGPIVGQMVHPYLKRRRGLEPVHYEHPALERILHKTLGVPLFQEQVMRIAVELAGFSPGESDELRRAISGWRADGRLSALGRAAGIRAQGQRTVGRSLPPAFRRDQGLRLLRLPRVPRGQLRPVGLRQRLDEVPPSGRVRLRPAQRPAAGLLRRPFAGGRRQAPWRGGAGFGPQRFGAGMHAGARRAAPGMEHGGGAGPAARRGAAGRAGAAGFRRLG